MIAMLRTLKFLVPITLFIVLFVFLLRGLDRKPGEVPSPFIGKEAPAFSLPQLDQPERLESQALLGKVWLLNVWASWCAACRDEHPLLMQLSKDPRFVIVGIDYKDVPDDARAWLKERGNPYQKIVTDLQGRTGIEYGVYGVPETFVIDRKGIIRYKQIGALTDADVQKFVVPLLSE